MLPRYCVIDGFLGAEAAAGLLDFAIAAQDGFGPSTVYKQDSDSILLPEARDSLRFRGDWSDHKQAFSAQVEARVEELVSGAGSPGFRPDALEIELVANREGGHFERHIDTRTSIADRQSDRIVSAVYYFHRTPKAFSGGELAIHALVGDEQVLIEPRHDRLVVFTSIAPHTVLRTQVPGDGFADARFSINCWLLRRLESKQRIV